MIVIEGIRIYIKNKRAKSCCRDNRDYIQETNDVYAVGNIVRLCNRLGEKRGLRRITSVESNYLVMFTLVFFHPSIRHLSSQDCLHLVAVLLDDYYLMKVF